jgi:chromosome segregation ATPase
MKPDQIEKRINWLDEQRRKDNELTSLLERKVEEVNEIIEMQANQLKELSSEVTRLSAVATQIQQFDQALRKQREDFSRKLEDTDALYSEKQRHMDDLRKHDYEEFSKSISEFKFKLQDLDRLKDTVEARKQEETRMNREIVEMDDKVDSIIMKAEEQGRALHSIEETRKKDTRRITDLQTDSTENRLKLDKVRGKQDSLEDRIRRVETRIEELEVGEKSRREVYNLWEEKQELRMVEFEKRWKEWQVKFDEIQKMVDEVDDRILKYDENYRALSKAREELDKLIDRLERRITEISEMQRITEERTKQEWNSFQADQQKQWNTYKLTNDEMWRDHDRIHDRISQEIQRVSDQLAEGLEGLEELAEKSQDRILDILNIVKVWTNEIEKKVSEVR